MCQGSRLGVGGFPDLEILAKIIPRSTSNPHKSVTLSSVSWKKLACDQKFWNHHRKWPLEQGKRTLIKEPGILGPDLPSCNYRRVPDEPRFNSSSAIGSCPVPAKAGASLSPGFLFMTRIEVSV